MEGELKGRPLNPDLDPRRTIVVIWNHGFSPEAAGTYRPEAPPIIERLVERNRDVVLFKQLRNGTWLGELDHSAYVDAAIASLVAEQHVPVENIILSGQSCGAWGSLQTAAFRYPNIGGIVAFAPTCHGRLPHAPRLRARHSRKSTPSGRSRSCNSEGGLAAAHIAIRMNERIWIVGRRIMVRRERISRRQMFAISIVAGLTAGLGLIIGASVKRSYEDQLQRRFRTKPRWPDQALWEPPVGPRPRRRRRRGREASAAPGDAGGALGGGAGRGGG